MKIRFEVHILKSLKCKSKQVACAAWVSCSNIPRNTFPFGHTV